MEQSCCIARYDDHMSSSMVQRIMMKYRPIAPKPPPSITTSTSTNNSPPSPKHTGRGKRKNAAANKRCSGNKRRKSLSEDSVTKQDSTVFKTVVKKDKVVVGTWMKVIDTWAEEGYCGLAAGRYYTDQERLACLDADTCPCFVSDGMNRRVRWMNAAYREMVLGGSEEEVVVVGCLVLEDGVVLPEAFTCRVKVVTCGSKTMKTQTLPCDVWRLMDCGGFAWRLDTTAALSLGRSLIN